MTQQTRPSAGAGAILELGTAFCTARCVLTAVDLDLFTVLEGAPATAAELGDQLGLHPRGVPAFLDVLVELGLLQHSAGTYRNDPAATRHLVSGRSGDVTGFLRRSTHMLWPAWTRFDEMLRTGKPTAEADYTEMIKDPAKLRRFLGMMDALNGLLAPELAEAFDWSGRGTVLDVGGARGNLVGNLVKLRPHLRGMVFDLPQMADPFAEHMAALELTGKVTFHSGSFFDNPLPRADVVCIGHVLHDWAEDECRAVVAKAFEAVNPGGALLVYDRMLRADGRRLPNLVISLDMMLTTPGGQEYPAAEYEQWLAGAGFQDISARPLGEDDTLVVGHKPR
ncbi:methyltransferase [Actinoplanes sp. N902-109]|uniref:methyltransferase n=1 Tax=Actinoplanes sp. (strain N902-109) TaxID=649831 RepID=UPI0003293D2D|nr:methyltransferase [Actinoplanes sp. N902-109]AGL16641.1 O-methyltransferase family protein [Actinoplanes sp. N902-109]